ncbi:DUF2975 domain-containing protein [uncultured Shewanella sp.]|uniref:DUF2975 domain-containing protein n=1 Tax=uncultured Shewanella sp. TaxID=173975 RepID=UPI00262823FC|nr:DUF2975 domain-containing protein [uncultured Shewanella sp.]
MKTNTDNKHNKNSSIKTNNNMKKLMKISGVFRVLVILAMAVIVAFLGYSYIDSDELRLGGNPLFHALWFHEGANRGILFTIQFPLFFALVLGVFWMQKLLGYFQQGQFFSSQTMNCYLWLIWIKIVSFVYKFIQPLMIHHYYSVLEQQSPLHLTGHFPLQLEISFDSITTLLLLLVIAYLLKAAKDIEAENKAFI